MEHMALGYCLGYSSKNILSVGDGSGSSAAAAAAVCISYDH